MADVSITVDGTARTYQGGTDPAYKKQLDRGDTKLATASFGASTNLSGSGVSHLIKTHAAAGNDGRRSTCSIKDEPVIDGIVRKDTVVVTAYHPYNDGDAEERCVRLYEAQYAYLSANDFAEFRALIARGKIDID
jgi:hypothetical protein